MIRRILTALLLTMLAFPAEAEEAAQPPEQEEQKLGNPLGQAPTAQQGPAPEEETKAEEETHAVKLSFLYSAELWDNVAGGIKQGQSSINNLDGSIAVDGAKAFNWDGAKFMLDVFYARSGDLRNLSGAEQQTSAYETDTGNLFRVYQAWYDQSFNQDRTSILVGLYDLNTEFDTFESSELFFNSGFGLDTSFDQSGRNGPSTYPDTSLGLRLRQKLTDTLSLQAAVLDGVPDNPAHPTATAIQFGGGRGYLGLAELDYLPDESRKIIAGYWRYTSAFTELPTAAQNQRGVGNQGGYAGIGQTLFQEQDGPKLAGFLRFGVASDAFNEFGQSGSTGLVYSGFVPGRDKDQLGLAFDMARNGAGFEEQQSAAGVDVRGYESNLELTYRAPVTDWLTVQPDAQYTVNPGTNPALKNDFLIGIRLEFGYQKGFDSL